MKKKLSRILGVGLAVAMLSSMMVMAAPASAGTLSWGNEASITNLKANIDNIIAPTDLDVVDIAVAGDVINRGCVRDDAAEASHAPARVQLPLCFGQELIGL